MGYIKTSCHARCVRCMALRNCDHEGNCGDKCARCKKEKDTQAEKELK